MSARISAGRRQEDGRFALRWIAAVTAAVAVAGVAEYAYAAHQLQARVVEESARDFQMDARAVEETLVSGLTPPEQRDAIRLQLNGLLGRRGVAYVGLFAPDGSLIIGTDPGSSADSNADEQEAEEEEGVDPALVEQVLTTQQPWWGEEHEDGEVEDDRYEFLLPLRSATGPLVMEVDQRADIHKQLVADLRTRELLGLVLAMAVAVPLSYLIGGRSLRRQHRRTQRAADTDPLTGLLGRRLFAPVLVAELAAPEQPVALALLDLDDFKRVNDKLGHGYGDRVLRAVADSLSGLRPVDTAFRLGGDEFAVVLPGLTDEQAVVVLERVRAMLSEREPGITLSCGIASSGPGGELSRAELWERADSALYEAKRRGRRRTVTFSTVSEHLTVTADKLDAVTELLARSADLTVAFQPIWDLRARRVLGHEALLRLPEDLPIAGPGEAFDLAHRLGFAEELDTLARRAIFRAVGEHDWHGALFVNVHPESLRQLDVESLVAQARAAGLAPADVVVEVTEHADLDNAENVRMLKALRERGFRLALDDFGQGNAGLRALTHVQFDVVKVDRQVIARIDTDPASAAVVSAATTFVAHTGGWVIAEGIELASTVGALLGGAPGRQSTPPVLAGQGYLLGRPAPHPVALDSPLAGLHQDAVPAQRGTRAHTPL